MSGNLGVVMDPIADITPYKDTTLALMLAAQKRGWTLHYMEISDLNMRAGKTYATTRTVNVRDDNNDWFEFTSEPETIQLDCVLMRKDPPFNMEFVYATYLLERAQAAGVRVVNDPRTLRDANEKLFTAWFADVCPETLVTRRESDLKAFMHEFGDIVVKPPDGMGGASIFRVKQDDPNASVIFETLTQHGSSFCVAQPYLPEIVDGDKRILVINGEPVEYALARLPAAGELRGNLAAGGRGRAQPLSDSDRAIAERVAPELVARGLIFVGLDVIGDKLTEINVTSPTCVREIEAQFEIDIAGRLIDAL